MMKTKLLIIESLILLLISTTTISGQDPISRDEAQQEVLEVAGVLKSKDERLVCVWFAGEYKILSEFGQSVGPYKMVGVDPKAEYVDFAKGDDPVRVWIRRSVIVESEEQEPREPTEYSRREMVEILKSKIVIVGGELSDKQMEQEAESILQEILTNPIYSDPKYVMATREEYLADILNGTRQITIVGENGISEGDAEKLGMTEEKRQRLEILRELGKREYGIVTGAEVVEIPAEVFGDEVSPETQDSPEPP